jgi:hypothetical protein
MGIIIVSRELEGGSEPLLELHVSVFKASDSL